MAKPEPSLYDAMQVQSHACAALGSHIHGVILTALADNLAANGIVYELTKDLDLRPGRDAVPLRIIGAAHREALAGRAPKLAAHYPSTGGTPGSTLVEDFLATLESNRDAIIDGLHRTVQTNEVGRTTMLVAGLAHFGRTYGVDSIHFREVGSSSGLNLLFDRFWFDNAGHTYGDAVSKVRFEADAWAEPTVDISGCPAVASRAGCDIAPLDVRDPERRLTLLSFVWPDQRQRFERLHAALDIATTDPTYNPPSQADAAEWIDDQLDCPCRRTDGRLPFHRVAVLQPGHQGSVPCCAAPPWRTPSLAACVAAHGTSGCRTRPAHHDLAQRLDRRRRPRTCDQQLPRHRHPPTVNTAHAGCEHTPGVELARDHSGTDR